MDWYSFGMGMSLGLLFGAAALALQHIHTKERQDDGY